MRFQFARVALTRVLAAVLAALLSVTTSASDVRAQCDEWIAGPMSPHIQIGTNGEVRAMVAWDPDGAGPLPPWLVLGGAFTEVQGIPANHVVAWDGLTWRRFGEGVNGEVYALTVHNGQLVVGGQFTNAGGVAANNVAGWNGSTWYPFGGGFTVPNSFDPPRVVTLADYNGVLWAGGTFQHQVSQWNGSNWVAPNLGLNGAVRVLSVANGTLYLGGEFDHSTTLGYVYYVVRYNGSAWSDLNYGSPYRGLTAAPNAIAAHGGYVYAATDAGLERYDGAGWDLQAGGPQSPRALLVSGGLLHVAGYCRPGYHPDLRRIQRFLTTTWGSMATGIGVPCSSEPGPQVVNALTEFQGLVYAGGYFDQAGGAQMGNLTRWTGAAWIAPIMPTRVSALAAFGAKLGIAGVFTEPTPTGDAHHVMAWDGLELSRLGSGLNGPALTACGYTDAGPFPSSHLIVGGAFSLAGGAPAANVAGWTEPSDAPPSWSSLGAGLNNTVLGLTPFRGSIVAGGLFTGSGATVLNRVGRWSGTSWSAMGTGMNGAVRTFKTFYDNLTQAYVLVAGGDFTQANGLSANRIASWVETTDAPPLQWQGIQSGFNNSVFAIERLGTTLIAAGAFTASGTNPVNYIAKSSGGAWVRLGLQTPGGGFNGPVYSLRVEGGYLYAGGDFTMADGVPAYHAARWTGLAWAPVSNGPSHPVVTLASYHGELVAGGEFQWVESGLVPTFSMARFLVTGTPWIADQPDAQTVQAGQNAAFQVEAADGYDGLEYRWHRNGLPLEDGPTGTGSTLEGTSLPWLLITGAAVADSGSYMCTVSNACGVVESANAKLTVTGATGVGDAGSAAFGLSVRPMPARSQAHVSFTLPEASPVTLEVLDVAGRRIRELANGPVSAGPHELSWDTRTREGERARPGVYLIRMTTAGLSAVRRVVVID